MLQIRSPLPNTSRHKLSFNMFEHWQRLMQEKARREKERAWTGKKNSPSRNNWPKRKRHLAGLKPTDGTSRKSAPMGSRLCSLIRKPRCSEKSPIVAIRSSIPMEKKFLKTSAAVGYA